jgi:hypothetical protein
MDDRTAFLRNPKWQVVLVSLAVLILYLALTGRQGVASGVALADDQVYLSIGKYGGLQVVQQTPIEGQVRVRLKELATFETTGDARRVEHVDGLLYVADGRAGLAIVDVSDPARPVMTATLRVGGDVQDVVAQYPYVYLAAGAAGLVVVDTFDPHFPMRLGAAKTVGAARGVALAEDAVTYEPLPLSLNPYLYVATGGRGLAVVDVSWPYTPTVLAEIDLPGEAHQVVVQGMYAFVAAGPAGLRVVDVSNPLQPRQVGFLDTKGDARALAVRGEFVYLADGAKGLRVLTVNRADPTQIAEVMAYDTPGSALGLALKWPYAFVADGSKGLNVINVARYDLTAYAGKLNTPGEAPIPDLFGAFLRVDMAAKELRTLLFYCIDGILLFATLLFGVAFFAQFVLPVQTITERMLVIDRLFTYLMGGHGPAVFIENGEVQESEKEKKKRGPGVVLLDTASAAVFRNAHTFTRPSGPGIYFTNYGEYIAGALDLHRQVKFMGPRANEDPFVPKKETEPQEEYEARQKRRLETSALTRDGVEVVPNVLAIFQLDPSLDPIQPAAAKPAPPAASAVKPLKARFKWFKPRPKTPEPDPIPGKTRFGYSGQAAWRAITHEGIRVDAPQGAQDRRLAWDWLPAYLTIDLWREYLRKFTLDELFSFSSVAQSGDGPRQTAMDRILGMIRERLTKPEVDMWDDTGHPVPELDQAGRPMLDETGKPIHKKMISYEYKQMSSRGLRLIASIVRNLRFPAPVEERLVNQWQVTWLERAKDDAKEVERQLGEERLRGEREALKLYALGASMVLSSHLPPPDEASKAPDLADTLEYLVQGTLSEYLRDPDLRNQLTYEKSNLANMIEWIRKNRNA